MSWVKVCDKAWAHPKFANLSGGAVRLWLFALCWSNQQEKDGEVPSGILRLLGGTAKQAAELVKATLWETRGEGWAIHDYLHYQPGSQQIRAKREAKALAGSMGGRRSGESRREAVASNDTKQNRSKTKAGASQLVKAKRTPVPVPVPVPVPSELTAQEEPAPSGGSSRRKPTRPIPDNWAPAERHHSKAAERGIDCDLAAQKFQAHAEAQDRRCVDWDRAFDSWLLNERGTPQRVNVGNANAVGFDPFERVRRLREAENAKERAV
jgi:hypothetical protein